MSPDRFDEIVSAYSELRIAVVGDFCLDRYLEIDPARAETSIETQLPVHNVTHVRYQPGGAGTIVNNLSALGVKEIFPIGFCGNDAEGFELLSSLERVHRVHLDHFLQTSERRTFTYCKPLLMREDGAPEELSRLDFKNWTPTPDSVAGQLAHSIRKLGTSVNAMIVLDQVDEPDTGVINRIVLEAIGEVLASNPNLTALGDSRRGFENWPRVSLKMNAAEFERFMEFGVSDVGQGQVAGDIVGRHGQMFVTMADDGIVGFDADGIRHHDPALPVRGEIDIVGAGDAVTANLTCALASGAKVDESILLANRAASIVIHQLGTTGTASVEDMRNTASK
ncbi:MAG: rfaE bifunctional protein kinase chain/domain [Limisphaerales bacterium]|jgi:rfaE bifunctional protein kinase chain/domain